jgi:putative ABC transport system substrate-binding protein
LKRTIFASLVFLLVCFLCTLSWPANYTISVSQIVQHPSLDAMRQGFMDYLADKGFQVKYNVHIAGGNPATNLQIASRIIEEDPHLVLTISTPSSQACAQKIKGKTILFAGVTDPVGAGLVKSLEKPGANITGTTDMSPIDRHILLMKEIHPKLKKLGVIYNPGEANSVTLVKALKKESAKFDIVVQEAKAVKAAVVGKVARSIVGRCDAVYVPTDNTVISRLEVVAKICGENKVPLYTADVDSVPRGAVAALAIDYYRLGRQTGSMAERIFNGDNPTTMPVETLRKLKLYVNLKAAANMGVEVPVDLILAADAVFNSFPP